MMPQRQHKRTPGRIGRRAIIPPPPHGRLPAHCGFFGLEILRENDDEHALALWRSARAALRWAESAPIAHERRSELGTTATPPVAHSEREIEAALMLLQNLSERGGKPSKRDVVAACSQVARWDC